MLLVFYKVKNHQLSTVIIGPTCTHKQYAQTVKDEMHLSQDLTILQEDI